MKSKKGDEETHQKLTPIAEKMTENRDGVIIRDQPEPSDTMLFRAVVHEIWETDSSVKPDQILDWLIKGELEKHCDYHYFCRDDGDYDQGEIFLLEWMKSKKGNEETRQKLTPIAEKMSEGR